jgi:flagellar basal body L-ring protein FlgH
MIRVLKSLFFLMAAVIVSSCAFFESEVVQKDPPKTEPTKKVMPPPAPKHELGSIWSEGSKWNELYSGYTGGRSVGDVIFVKPGEAFKGLIAPRGDRPGSPPIEYPGSANSHDSNLVVVSIKDVLSPGIYVISGDQQLKVRGHDEKISLSGKIRERDIGADDSAPSDAVFDMNLEVNGSDVDTENMKTSVSEKGPTKDPTGEPNAGNKPPNPQNEKDKGSETGSKVSGA